MYLIFKYDMLYMCYIVYTNTSNFYEAICFTCRPVRPGMTPMRLDENRFRQTNGGKKNAPLPRPEGAQSFLRSVSGFLMGGGNFPFNFCFSNPGRMTFCKIFFETALSISDFCHSSKCSGVWVRPNTNHWVFMGFLPSTINQKLWVYHGFLGLRV